MKRLLLIGGGHAHVEVLRRFALEGAWVWRWKDWIDQRFVERYR